MSEDPPNRIVEPDDPEEPQGTVQLNWPSLTIHWPDGSTTKAQVGLGITRVGREPSSNDVVIPESFKTVSRDHFEIQRRANGFVLLDKDSGNGVFVNDERVVGEINLGAGDQIAIGAADHNERIEMEFDPGTVGFQSAAHEGAGELPADSQEPAEEIKGPAVELRFTGGIRRRVQLTAEVNRIGRRRGSEIELPESLAYVSADHAEIRPMDEGYSVVDLDSTNGTWLNGQRLEPNQPQPLHDGAILRIGDDDLGVSVGLAFFNPEERAAAPVGYGQTARMELPAEAKATLTIGRAADCDLQLVSPSVSRHHAELFQRQDDVWIRDLGSLNGTFVNGNRIQQARVSDGDLVTIQDHALLFRSGQLTEFQQQGMRLDAIGLRQQVPGKDGDRLILDDINFSVLPREFVGLVGASGSGKSTLMSALLGIWPAQGEVRVNGRDLYEQYEDYRAKIGYVPQADILHSSLTVDRALWYSAQLRLPPDLSKQERERRIDQVLATVEMGAPSVRATPVGRLSGGQRKRVSIAAELLADPKLFFLDEATSGLDPGLEKKMMHTLRRMADEGRTVMLITHATANIVQVDHVLFLAGGKAAYFGPPSDALDFFQVDEFADIYERTHGQADDWVDMYQHGRPEYYQRYVEERRANMPVQAVQAGIQRIGKGLAGSFRQLRVLTQRTLEVLASDRLTLMLLLLLFPLTATLQLVISTPDILTGDPTILSDPAAAAQTLSASYNPLPDLNTFVFVMGLEAVLVGMYVPSNELIRERTIYLRERMVNLGVVPYLLSKVAVFTMFAAIQSVLYLLVLSVGVDFPSQGLFLPFPIEAFVTLFLTMLAGTGLGFLVSAISRSTDMAIYMLVILMFFEFFFAGTVFDMRENPAKPISYLTATRWSLDALGVSIGMPAQAESTILCNDRPDNPLTPEVETGVLCEPYPDATDDLLLPYDDGAVVRGWAVLLLMTVATVGVTGLLIRRLDPI
ncbi:MAG: FHA domain-containing protein [Anaerolineales bacterium]